MTDKNGNKKLFLLFIVLALVVGGGVLSVPIILPAIQAIREAARRDRCVAQLKQIGEALENYKQKNALPQVKPFLPAGTTLPFVVPLDEAKVGELPKGWTATKTGDGPGSVWKIVEDATAPNGKTALAQTSDQGPKRLFNLCICENTTFTDIDLTVAFKAVAGKVDQGGGPVWRYKDADNYYVARMNPLEDNYRVYKVVAGKRTQLASADVKTPKGDWHTLHVVQKADHIQCYLDGKLHLDVKDDTFKNAGKIGLWTKADAQTYFADLKLKEPE